VNQTSSTAPYSPPLNRQQFAALVTPGFGRAIRSVTLSVQGAMSSMTNAGGTTWQGSPFLLACQDVVQYNFVVESSGAQGTNVDLMQEAFPPNGFFTRTITNQPADCATSPLDASGVEFQVNTTVDLVDARPGDGFCSTTPDPHDPTSQCSLRAAVMEANHKPGFDLIVLPPAIYRLSLVGQTGAEVDDTAMEAIGDLDITESVVIESSFARAGCPTTVADFLDPQRSFADRGTSPSVVAKIDAGQVDRVIDVYGAGTQVYLSCLHVTGGHVGRDDVTTTRRFGGAIMNRGVMVMRRVAVTDNSMLGVAAGVGLSNAGEVSLQESAFFHNLGPSSGAAFGGTDGGAVYSAPGSATSVDRSVFAFNQAARGTAIENNGTITVVNSTFSDNTPVGSAGTLGATFYNAAGQARISWSTFAGPGAPPSILRSADRLWIDNSLIATPYSGRASSACADDGNHTAPNDPGAAGIVAAMGVRTTDVNCIPLLYRGRWNNVVQPFLREFSDLLSMTGPGFTPVLSIHRYDTSLGEAPADSPVNNAFPLGRCPPVDQRGAQRPDVAGGLCDPGAMELQSSEQ
jgi:CSLREA domain-containing protein